jgi:hypothetical protein
MEERDRTRRKLVAGLVLLSLTLLLFRRISLHTSNNTGIPPAAPQLALASANVSGPRPDSFPRLRRLAGPPQSAEEIVASKLVQFAANRRKLMNSLARRTRKPVPPEVERFFDALEQGHWEEADAIFDGLHNRHENPNGAPDEDLYAIWRPIQETQGIQWEARHWPAEQLLKYGEKVLGSLKPGTVFIGGTDPGAFINTFLNETSEGEHHMMFTQNALADSSYIKYLNTLYGDRLKFPEKTDQDAAFKQYIDDISSRAAHDHDFPDESKQVRPGENFALVDGKPQVSGQMAVMSINELLLNRLLELNPDKSFALEESFSLKSTYKDAAPLGPIMELRAGVENKLTRESAAEAVQAWRSNAQELLESTTDKDEYPRKAWSHMAVAQANLLIDRDFPTEAEETLRLAQKMYPDNFEASNRLVDLYRQTGREVEAEQLMKEVQPVASKH